MTTQWRITARTWGGEERVFIGFSKQECLRWWDAMRELGLHAPELEEIHDDR